MKFHTCSYCIYVGTRHFGLRNRFLDGNNAEISVHENLYSLCFNRIQISKCTGIHGNRILGRSYSFCAPNLYQLSRFTCMAKYPCWPAIPLWIEACIVTRCLLKLYRQLPRKHGCFFSIKFFFGYSFYICCRIKAFLSVCKNGNHSNTKFNFYLRQ